MGQVVTGTNTLQTNFQQTTTFGVGGSGFLVNPVKFLSSFQAAGVIADTCNLFYAATLSLAATPTTLDLKSGLLDIGGLALVFVRVRFVALRVNSTTNGQVLVIGNSVTNEWNAFLSATGTLTIAAGTASNNGFFMLQAPNTTGYLVGSSSKTLKLDPGASTFTVDVLIAGCDA